MKMNFGCSFVKNGAIFTLPKERTFLYNGHKLHESGDHHGKSELGNT